MSTHNIPPRALILAAGLGTRLQPMTDATPKCLLPIAGHSLLDFWLESVARAGIRDVLINTHALAEQVRAYIQRVNRRGGLRLVESYEPALLGSAGTIADNGDWAEEAGEIVVIYGDNLSGVSLSNLLAFHRTHADPLTMLLFHVDNPTECGIAELDNNARLVSFVEKPKDPHSDLANAGVYVMDRDAYREIADQQAFDIAFDVLPNWIGRMRGYVTQEIHLDIGTPPAYQRAQEIGERLLADRGYDDQGRRPAVFFDRDGTLIESVDYLADPEDVQLVPGAADAVRQLRQAGYACIVATNQSGVGRGFLTEDGLSEIHQVMCHQFAQAGAVLDAVYHCPVVPKVSDRITVENVFRKPGPGMLQQAARELKLDLSRSWMVGDTISDALAGRNAGCLGSILVATGQGLEPGEEEWAKGSLRARDVAAAAAQILNSAADTASQGRSEADPSKDRD